jgi:1-acyl-sn-glycerol-3-phosphate acyltransferase
MTSQPRSLRFGRSRPLDPAIVEEGIDGWALPRRRSLRRMLLPPLRLVLVLLWTALAAVVQAPMLVLPGRGKVVVPRIYWGGMCAILGLGIRVVGTPAHRTADGRPVIFVSNHSSWLDILVLGARLEACFIAKEEVGRWPVIRTIARLGRTVYVRRQRNSTARERDEMRARLAAGDSLVLFPEGTTSDGSRVLEFRSAFLSIAETPASPAGLPPIVQPVSIVYDRLAGLPTGRASRPLFSWYGDMEIASHYWQLARHGGMRASVILHAPLDPRDFANRKALARATWAAAAEGAALLRQNRPAHPIGPAPEASAPAGPAFA